MKTGLLWYDSDPGQELAEKIRQAAARFEEKSGTAAEVCFVHPSALGGEGRKLVQIGGVKVLAGTSKRPVLLHHFWVGREGKKLGRRG